MTEPQRGLLAHIKAPKNSCGCQGTISQAHDHVVVIDPLKARGRSEESPTTPAVIVKRDGGRVYVEPTTPPPAGDRWDFGGCFVETSDSRFGGISQYPVPIHDRLRSQTPPPKLRGLVANIYASKEMLGEHCTCASNDGISSRANQVLVVCDEPECQAEETPDRPAVTLRSRRAYTYAVPASPPKPRDTHTDRMFGGCFAFADTEAFRRIISSQPVPLHDRQETWEEYEILSR